MQFLRVAKECYDAVTVNIIFTLPAYFNIFNMGFEVQKKLVFKKFIKLNGKLFNVNFILIITFIASKYVFKFRLLFYIATCQYDVTLY